MSLQTDIDEVYLIALLAQGYDRDQVEPWRTFTAKAPIPLAEAIRQRTPMPVGSDQR